MPISMQTSVKGKPSIDTGYSTDCPNESHDQNVILEGEVKYLTEQVRK